MVLGGIAPVYVVDIGKIPVVSTSADDEVMIVVFEVECAYHHGAFDFSVLLGRVRGDVVVETVPDVAAQSHAEPFDGIVVDSECSGNLVSRLEFVWRCRAVMHPTVRGKKRGIQLERGFYKGIHRSC